MKNERIIIILIWIVYLHSPFPELCLFVCLYLPHYSAFDCLSVASPLGIICLHCG